MVSGTLTRCILFFLTIFKTMWNPYPPCLHNDVQDRITWADHLDNIYTARSGYSWLISFHLDDLHNDDISWNWIWKMKAPEKVKLFFWTASHESFPTKALLHRRGMAFSPSCHRCDDHVEDLLHCLRDFPLAACIWRSLGYNSTTFFQELHTHSWLKKGLRLSDPHIFVAGIWCI